MHLIFGVARLHLSGAAGVLQRPDAVAKALIRQRGEVIPPGCAVRNAVQHAAGLGVAPVRDEVAGGLQLRRVGAVIAGAALLLVAAEPEAKAEGVKAEVPVAVLLGIALLAVILLETAVIAAAIALLAVGAAIAAALGAGLALGDGVVGGLNFLEVLLGRGVVGGQVGVPALALGTVSFFDLVFTGTALDAQNLIGVSHRSTSSRLYYHLCGHCAAQAISSVQDWNGKIKENRRDQAVLSFFFAFLQ